MVNAATDMQIGNDFYKEGSKLPDNLVKELEEKDPSLLSNYVEVNGRWLNIDDKRISGMVKERKYENRRLKLYFNVKEPIPKEKDKMLKIHKESKLTKEQLQEKAEKMGFEQFRKWANKKFKVTGRSIEGIIKDILSGKKEL